MQLMKARLHLALLLLAALTTIAALQPVGSSAFVDARAVEQGAADDSGSAVILLHAVPEGSLIDPSNEIPIPGAKSPTKNFAASIRVRERSIRACLTSYARASSSVVVALRGSDIIFPFHCFW